MSTATEAKTRRRTSHRVICPRCGSVQVVVLTTRTYHCTSGGKGRRLLLRKQNCKCTRPRCGHRWWRRVKVTEEELGGQGPSTSSGQGRE